MTETTETTPERAGELLREAVATAREFTRVEVIHITDPEDGTEAPFVIDSGSAATINRADFDQYRKAPVRRRGTANLTRVESFVAHVNRFKDDNSAIFADENPANPKLTAVLNYHVAGGFTEEPRFGDHRAVYAFPLSPEWKAWFGADSKPMSMTDFAAFLEDRIVDVLAEPGDMGDAAAKFITATGGKMATPTKLIEIARGLQVNESSVVKEARNLSTGEGEIVFEATHTGSDGKPLKLPNLFVIAIPVFQRSAVSYRLIARLRYRKTAAGLTFWFELWRPDLVFTDAFEEAVAMVSAETALPVFIGTDEGR